MHEIRDPLDAQFRTFVMVAVTVMTVSRQAPSKLYGDVIIGNWAALQACWVSIDEPIKRTAHFWESHHGICITGVRLMHCKISSVCNYKWLTEVAKNLGVLDYLVGVYILHFISCKYMTYKVFVAVLLFFFLLKSSFVFTASYFTASFLFVL